MNKGFTLVELSIVLVIIGLLIGGILVGQSLIASAKTQSQIRQIQQFDIAAAQFKDKFRNLPGDTNLFTDPGDKDGVLREAPLSSSNDDFVGELANFWKHLSESGFQPDGIIYDNDATTGIVAGVDMPKGIYDNSAVAVAGFWSGTTNYNYFCLGRFSDTGTSLIPQAVSVGVPYGVLSPTDALSIDKKIDDSMPGTGFIRASGPVGHSLVPTRLVGCVTTFLLPSSLYKVDNPDAVCYIKFRIGISRGEGL